MNFSKRPRKTQIPIVQKERLQKTKNEVSQRQSAIAGAVAGVVSRFIIAPLDVIKIRLQLQSRANVPTVHGTVRIFTTLLQREGVRALWKGNVPASLLYPLYGSVQFATYRRLTRFLQDLPTPPGAHAVNFVAGGLAGATATTATYPLDLLRTRLAAAYHHAPGTSNSFRPLSAALRALHAEHRQQPLRPYFRGLPAALVGIVPYMGLFFLMYQGLRTPITTLLSAGDPGWASALGAPDALAGTIAGVASKTVVFPFDTVRKRMQVQGQAGTAGVFPVHAGGVLKTLREVVVQDGVRGLYRGLGVGLVKAAPAGAVTVWAYERCLYVMRRIGEVTGDRLR
ncbi:mitochondrial thiamine pyrophosphate carrier 1 [Mycena albidolilacea]|uniref:Mitochondrial thiamine pyrophosphate carrier 1 n=1 Tax=Mycena albidolilacea TaxID=1033008 RepID=A0AAD7AVF4_9AGAR|nr:mitochondrial thiamine pyrophosphate carrier 1 [Mycena albidolilacea]